MNTYSHGHTGNLKGKYIAKCTNDAKLSFCYKFYLQK